MQVYQIGPSHVHLFTNMASSPQNIIPRTLRDRLDRHAHFPVCAKGQPQSTRPKSNTQSHHMYRYSASIPFHNISTTLHSYGLTRKHTEQRPTFIVYTSISEFKHIYSYFISSLISPFISQPFSK